MPGESLSSADLVDEDRPSGGMAAWLMEVMRTWMPAILAVLFIRTFIFEPFRIPSGSMIPTLQIGDHVVVNKASYGLWVPWTGVEVPFMESAWVVPRFELMDLGDPARGDIIVFRYPQNEALNYIKRVVAVPGDKIKVKGNQILLNGEPQDLTFVDKYDSLDDSCSTTPTKRYRESLSGLDHQILMNAGMPGSLATWPRNGQEETVPAGHVFVMGDNRDNSEDGRRWGFVRYDQIKGKAHFVWFSWDSCEQKVRAKRFFQSLYQIAAD